MAVYKTRFINCFLNSNLLCECYYVNCFVSDSFAEDLNTCSPSSWKKKCRKVTFKHPSILRTWSFPPMRNCFKSGRCKVQKMVLQLASLPTVVVLVLALSSHLQSSGNRAPLHVHLTAPEAHTTGGSWERSQKSRWTHRCEKQQTEKNNKSCLF